MIAVDTNILVYSQRTESPWFEAADKVLAGLAESGAPWAIPWPCIHEFVAVVTNPRLQKPPTPLKEALEQVECWLESPTLQLLAETGGYWQVLRETLERSKARGGVVHDARIAALCIHYGVTQLWTADRDFLLFPGVKAVNPLTAGGDRID